MAANELFADGNRPPTVLHGRSRVCSGTHCCHNVARTTFLAPKGMFTPEGLAHRLGVGLFHEYPRPVRPGSWVEQTLWRVRVDRWNEQWDVVGFALRSAAELPPVAEVMDEALRGFRSC